MFNADPEAVRTFTLDENKVQVRQVGPDTAVIAYNVQSTLAKEGQSRTIDAVDTSTWIKRGDKWVCAMHTETELSGPKK